MATFTYEQFEKSAKDSGLYDGFSQADINLAKKNPDAGMSILKYKQDYINAATDEARALANAGAENIRSSYGNYKGGADGGGFYLNQLSPGSFSTQNTSDLGSITVPNIEKPTYENRYDDRFQNLLDQVISREEFKYDPDKDALMSQYRKTYAREGQRATQDTLGAAASASGGLPSSYAVTAAAQAGNYYSAQMADKLPELYDLAYNKYLSRYNMDLQNLEALRQSEQHDYNKYLNELEQYNADRSFNYGVLLDEIQSQQSERGEAITNAQLAAQYGDYSKLNDMGINTDNNSADWERRYNLAVLAAERGDNSLMEALVAESKKKESEKDSDVYINGSGGYNNGNLTREQVQKLQKYYGVSADGMWGPDSAAAAGGINADAAWKKFTDGGAVSDTHDVRAEAEKTPDGTEKLSRAASDSYDDLYRSMKKNGYETLTDQQKKDLRARIINGVISEAELDAILDRLGL